jgi:hypothetical protein
MEVLKSEKQDELVKEYRVEGNAVFAVFFNKKDMIDYIKKNSSWVYKTNWYDKVGFCDFQIHGECSIKAHSTYHPISSIIEMFENGLSW